MVIIGNFVRQKRKINLYSSFEVKVYEYRYSSYAKNIIK